MEPFGEDGGGDGRNPDEPPFPVGVLDEFAYEQGREDARRADPMADTVGGIGMMVMPRVAVALPLLPSRPAVLAVMHSFQALPPPAFPDATVVNGFGHCKRKYNQWYGSPGLGHNLWFRHWREGAMRDEGRQRARSAPQEGPCPSCVSPRDLALSCQGWRGYDRKRASRRIGQSGDGT